MRQKGLQAKAPRRFVTTTDSRHDEPVFPNLARDLVASGSDHANRLRAPGLLHHSDRGGQYAARDYRDRLKTYKMTGWMSRSGNP